MNKKQTFEREIGGKKIKVQLGGLADQASGCALLQLGETSVMTTAQIGEERPEMGFFPLSCDYEERFYAAGKILGSRFIRREGRPSTEAVLNARLIDRAVRPLFPKHLPHEMQVIATCLSWDSENDPAVLGLLGASLALGISDIPWLGPLGAVRVGRVDGRFILNPTYEEREKGDLDIVLAGVKRGENVLINMIEGKANEVAEEVILGVYDFALPFIKELVDFQEKIIGKAGQKKMEVKQEKLGTSLDKKIKKFLEGELEKAIYQKAKQERHNAWVVLQQNLLEKFQEELGDEKVRLAKNLFIEETEKLVKENILKNDRRPDGRALDEMRDIFCQVGFLPRTHGSGMFQRGETRILSILTLGAPGDQQLVEGMEISGKRRFLHHYNFPPYSSGEVKRLGSPGRREIGHGMLAERAVMPLLPDFDDFPYTIRVVSESLSSNGSTSMASVSGACLALMDAGVPIKRAAAGIAIGLVVGETLDNFKLLTDIQGPEDHHGEMDLKAAGTEEGLTVVQMDVKTDGLTKEMLKGALEKARAARLKIIDTMKQTIAEPRKELSPYAPRIYTLQINPEKIGMVIGTGGKTINGIIDECDVSIDIEDDGKVFVSAEKEDNAKKAIDRINNIVRELEVGEVFQGTVKTVVDFGAFVEIVPGREGLVHISRLAPFRVENIKDIIKPGDKIPVKIIGIDDMGKIALSAKEAGFAPKQPSTETRGPKKREPRPKRNRRFS